MFSQICVRVGRTGFERRRPRSYENGGYPRNTLLFLVQSKIMPIPSARFTTGEDVYFKYDFEDSAFRYEGSTGDLFTKFRGERERAVETSTTLATDARLGGELITEEEYKLF